jgi:hypothetical protein
MTGQQDNISKKRRRVKWLVGAVLVGLLLLFVICDGVPDLRFRMIRLGGLESEEVIGRVGPPDYDSAKDTSDPWTPEREKRGEVGRRQFFYEDRYRWPGYEYAIEFENNRVVSVHIGNK